MRPFNRLPIASLVCLSLLLAGCGHGPRLNVCASDPARSQFECSLPSTLFHHPKPTTLSFDQSGGYVVYPPLSIQALYNYCAARSNPSTQAPQFTSCISAPGLGGLECRAVACTLIHAGGGVACKAGDPSLVPWSATENFIGFSPTDNATLAAYCNVAITEIEL